MKLSAERRDELRTKFFKGLDLAHEKMVADKIKNGQPLVVWQDGRIVHLDPRTREVIAYVD
jgi:hypothetical protein